MSAVVIFQHSSAPKCIICIIKCGRFASMHTQLLEHIHITFITSLKLRLHQAVISLRCVLTFTLDVTSPETTVEYGSCSIK